MAAENAGLLEAIDKALLDLGWSSIPKKVQWTSDALGLVAFKAGVRLIILSKNLDAVDSYGPLELKTVIYAYHKQGKKIMNGHFQAVCLLNVGDVRKIKAAHVTHLEPTDVIRTMFHLSKFHIREKLRYISETFELELLLKEKPNDSDIESIDSNKKAIDELLMSETESETRSTPSPRINSMANLNIRSPSRLTTISEDVLMEEIP